MEETTIIQRILENPGTTFFQTLNYALVLYFLGYRQIAYRISARKNGNKQRRRSDPANAIIQGNPHPTEVDFVKMAGEIEQINERCIGRKNTLDRIQRELDSLRNIVLNLIERVSNLEGRHKNQGGTT